MENCTELFLQDVATISGGNNPNWQYMTLYSNVEPCPMCAQAIIWRGVRRTVFGARASVLASRKCWDQSYLTFREVVRESWHFAPFNYVRGPLADMEETIVSSFPSFCKKN
jgi:tRNA(Arg) A34 adenosine deaminase TadA